MKINNVTQIKAEDFSKDDQQMAEQLALVLNPFMQQVVEIMDERLDFENRVENFIQIEMTVSSSGTPILNDKISTGKGRIRGLQVVAAFNLSNVSGFPTQSPFISYSVLGGGVIQVNNITGLRANEKYQLNIIVY